MSTQTRSRRQELERLLKDSRSAGQALTQVSVRHFLPEPGIAPQRMMGGRTAMVLRGSREPLALEGVPGIDTVEKLRLALQLAALIEFSTIPPYLTAMYSIQDKTSDAYNLIRSVVIEEMLHLNLASNLVNAIGASPILGGPDAGAVPPYRYPGRLPGHDETDSGPYLQLAAASPSLIQELFLTIERPAAPGAPPQSTGYSTIGQFYLAIHDGFEYCVKTFGGKKVFKDTGFQRVDYYYGNGGGTPITVTDLPSAVRAIAQIVEQGEGADTLEEWDINSIHEELQTAEQPWGAYLHYGLRPDGTYGPILGTPLELSHYAKFKSIADGVVPLPATYPMAGNPNLDSLASNPLARDLGEVFIDCFTILVNALSQALGGPRGGDAGELDYYYTGVVPMMQAALPVLATQLVQIPLDPKGSGGIGPNAGPPFIYRGTPDAGRIPAVREQLDRIGELLSTGSYPGTPPYSLPGALAKVARTLERMHTAVQGRASF